MDDHAYMQARTAHLRESFSGESSLPEGRPSSTTPSTSAYGIQDNSTTYASVAPFNNYSVPYDSSLPTPVSVAGSPSLSERASSKMMHSYSHHGGSSQQPTPPGTSRQWNPQMNVSSSQETSPMTVGDTTAGDMLQMHVLEASHSPEETNTMGVSSSHFHWGAYGVSSTEAQDDMSPHMAQQSLFHQLQPPSIAPSALLNRPSLGLNSSNIPLAPAQSHVPLLQQAPDPRDLGPSVTPIDNLHHHFPNFPQHNQQLIMMETPPAIYTTRKNPRQSRTGRSGRATKRARAPSRAIPRGGSSEYVGSLSGQPAGDANSGVQAEPPPEKITLNEKATAADRYLLDLRYEMDGEKGKGMWESMQKAWHERFGPRERANLQMNLTRSVMSHAVWPKAEDEALKRAVEELDRRRYTDLLKLMKEFGGCRSWDWRQGHVAKRLVEMGIDEFDPEEPKKKPRRQKKHQVRKQSTNSTHWTPAPVRGISLSYNDGLHTVTSEQEEYLLEQLCKHEPESPDLGMVQDMSEHPSRASMDMDPGESQSARVAKQACEQMLANRHDHMYGSLGQGRGGHHMQ